MYRESELTSDKGQSTQIVLLPQRPYHEISKIRVTAEVKQKIGNNNQQNRLKAQK